MMIPDAKLIAYAMKNPEFTYVKLSASWDKSERDGGGFILAWAAKNVGFGEFTFYRGRGKDKNAVTCETEGMSKKFIAAALQHFLSTITYEDK